MGAQKGKDLLLKIGKGGDPELFSIIAGLRTKTVSFNAKTIDVTDTESPDAWQELLPESGIKSATISGSGIFRDSLSDKLVREIFFEQALRNWQMILPDFGIIQGVFLVTELEYSGEYDGEASYTLTLVSAGRIQFSAL